MVFHIKMQPAEDGWFVVECPALAGCVSQGDDKVRTSCQSLDSLAS
jgi:predicted RNase H-like HicB family nuclease